MLIISKITYGERNKRYMYSNSGWENNPYPDYYAVVPSDMEDDIFKTQGFCDIKLNNDGTKVVSFTAREIPVIEEPEAPITEAEQLRADLDYLAIMTGVTL